MVKPWIIGLVLCAASLAVPREAAAQRPGSAAEMAFQEERVEGAHPAAVLLANRRALSLTDAQVVSLEAIRVRLRANNRESWVVLAEHAQREGGRESSASDPEARRAASSAVDEARTRIRENAETAAEEALGLLTEAQRTQLPGLLGG
jgi:hypothetical protein